MLQDKEGYSLIDGWEIQLQSSEPKSTGKKQSRPSAQAQNSSSLSKREDTVCNSITYNTPEGVQGLAMDTPLLELADLPQLIRPQNSDYDNETMDTEIDENGYFMMDGAPFRTSIENVYSPSPPPVSTTLAGRAAGFTATIPSDYELPVDAQRGLKTSTRPAQANDEYETPMDASL